MDADGSGFVRLTNDGQAVTFAISPDGERLAIHDADGSGLSAVPGVETAVGLAWRPE